MIHKICVIEGDENKLSITPLGGGNEVGRSCILINYKQKNILLDCGIHPGYDGINSLPFFDEIDPSDIDLLLVTHFHLDHMGAVPYFMEKTDFSGRVFMSHPTKAIYKWIMSDFCKVSHVAVDDMLFDENDVIHSFDRIEAIDYHSQVNVNGITFTAFYAGHVLGACMFLIEIAGVKLIYTGDYSREEDRHLMAAEIPTVRPDVLVVESTYGVQSHEPRADRESRFTRLVHDIVLRDGRCLIPVFALGGAQELLLILDEYWQSHPELHHIPIYYASSLAKKSLAIYQTFIHMMNEKIKKQFQHSNPFIFKHVFNLKSAHGFDDVGACVMLASPGMLQNGLSRELCEKWIMDKRNGLLIPGYVVDGTLGKDLLSEPSEITSMSGQKLPVRMSIDYISFSAHVDYTQNSAFIESVNAPHVVLVHGNATEMGRLKSALQRRFQELDRETVIYSPRNCESVDLFFRGEKMAQVRGELAREAPKEGTLISGILVAKDFKYSVVDADGLKELTDIATSRIYQRQIVRYGGTVELLVMELERIFDVVQVEEIEKGETRLTVCESININVGKTKLKVEWLGNPLNDSIADSIVAVILNAESCPFAVKQTTAKTCKHEHDDVKIQESENSVERKAQDVWKQRMLEAAEKLLGDHFVLEKKETGWHVSRNEESTRIDSQTWEVEGEGDFCEMVKNMLRLLKGAIDPVGVYSH